MVCIYCSGHTDVTNSRPQRRSNTTWRRRACRKCKAVVTTVESLDLSTAIMVSSQANKLSPFSRDKLFISIYLACKHRPGSVKDAGQLTDTVIASLHPQLQQAEVSSKQIARTAAAVLSRFDNAAYVQYTAYHSRSR